MIEKGGLALKPFVPQLQTTFVKCLADPARPVRQRAAAALGRLVTLQPRVDPLASDLLTTLDGATDKGVREAMLRAIAGVFAHAGKGVQPATVTRARVEISDALASTPDDGVRAAAALALAHVASWLTEDERVQLIEQLGEHDDGVDAETREGRAAALSAFARVSPELALASHAGPALNGLVRAARADSAAGRSAAALGMARLAIASALQSGAGCPYLPKLLPVMSKLLRDDDPETRVAAAAGLARLTREHSEATAPHLGAFVPALADVACGDKSKDARYYADRAIRAALMIVDEPAGLDMAQAVLRAGGAANAARGGSPTSSCGDSRGCRRRRRGSRGGWGKASPPTRKTTTRWSWEIEEWREREVDARLERAQSQKPKGVEIDRPHTPPKRRTTPTTRERQRRQKGGPSHPRVAHFFRNSNLRFLVFFIRFFYTTSFDDEANFD